MIEPLGYRVMIRPIDWEDKYTGQIVIPEAITDRARAGTQEGIVVGIGPTAYEDEVQPWCVIGQHVLFAKFGGIRVEDPETGEDFMLVNDRDVICSVTEEEKSE